MLKQAVYHDAQQVLAEAELFHSATDVERALDRMASEINSKLADRTPLCLCMMIGGIVPAGLLIPRLDFPLEVDYVHATRYRRETSGSDITWIYKPGTVIRDRTVLLIDDILDEGITLAALIDECKKQGAAEVYTAVLVDKQLNRPRTLETADFTGLTVPDRYVFGFGMDYRGFLRNAPGIYAVKNK